MWYNQEQHTRGYTITFPDGFKLTPDDEAMSPVRGWEWHDEEPEWWPIDEPND
jgi:hypothetical protein